MGHGYMFRTTIALQILGLWPSDKPDKTYEFRQRIKLIVLLYYMVGLLIYPFAILKDPKFPITEKIESFFVLTGLSPMLYNSFWTYYLRHDYMALLKKMGDFNDFGLPPNFERPSKIIDIVSVIIIGYTWMWAVVLMTFPLFLISSCKAYNQVHNTTLMCGYAAGLRYPYDIGTGFLYYLHWVIQMYSGMTMISSAIACLGLLMGCCEAIVIRLDHLISKLNDVFADDDLKLQTTRLRDCIMYHIHIFKLADDLNNSFYVVTGPTAVSYNITIGISIVAFLQSHSLKSVANTSSWIAASAVACFMGQRVADRSLAVAEIAYDIKWYVHTLLRRDIQFVILRAQKPIRITCGSLGDLSLELFKKIMKGAYTFATMRNGIGK